MVPRAGLEPAILSEYAPQAYAYANSATWAKIDSEEVPILLITWCSLKSAFGDGRIIRYGRAVGAASTGSAGRTPGSSARLWSAAGAHETGDTR
jgi:hypothetical protein